MSEREKETSGKRWYEKSPPRWYRAIGKYGVLSSILISALSLIIAIITLALR